MAEIYIPAEEVWPFFLENKARLEEEMIAIADNYENGYSLYLTIDKDLPLLIVFKGETEIYKEGAINNADCLSVIKKMSLKYLYASAKEDDKRDEEDFNKSFDDIKVWEMEEEANVRETELIYAFDEFMRVALNCEPEEMFNYDCLLDIMEDFFQMLYDKYEVSIYQPKICTNSNGWEYLEAYPYGNFWDAEI